MEEYLFYKNDIYLTLDLLCWEKSVKFDANEITQILFSEVIT